MSTIYEIPCSGGPRKFSINLGGKNYSMRTFYNDAPMGGWCFDLYDSAGNPLACGRPLVTGCDLLGQLGYLGVNGIMFVRTDGDPGATASFGTLGTQTHLYFEVID